MVSDQVFFCFVFYTDKTRGNGFELTWKSYNTFEEEIHRGW